MFRHYIAFFTYFNYFKIGKNITYRIIDIEALEELVLSSDEILFDVLRSRLLNDNISNNPFISLMRSVNIKNPIIKNGKRTRNRLISEVAKIKANYLDELTKAPSFEGKNGKNYVEAHHIIEFNGDNGPDITDNLICLGPQNHSLIHHGSSKAIDDFYPACITRGVISFDRFKNICEKYRCLTKKHVKILLSKSLISKFDADELNNLIDIYGVDDSFADIQT